MKFKDLLPDSAIVKEIPKQIIPLIADNEYHMLKSIMEDWYENKDTVYSFPTVENMFVKYIKKSRNTQLEMKKLMEIWWQIYRPGRKTNGEVFNETVFSIYREIDDDISIKELPIYDQKKFSEMFEGIIINKPLADFYNFFNRDTKTAIYFPELPRTKKIPLTFSRNHILNKFEKNSYFIRFYLYKVFSNYYSNCFVNGISWEDYIINLVVSAVTGHRICPKTYINPHYESADYDNIKSVSQSLVESYAKIMQKEMTEIDADKMADTVTTYATKAAGEYILPDMWQNADSGYMEARINAFEMCKDIAEQLKLKIPPEETDEFVLITLFYMTETAYDYEQKHSYINTLLSDKDKEYPVCDITYALVLAVFILFAKYLETIVYDIDKFNCNSYTAFINNCELLDTTKFYIFLDNTVQYYRNGLMHSEKEDNQS